MKKEHFCPSCDNSFTIKYKSGDPVQFCPFCSEELCQEDANFFEEDDE